MTIHAFDFDGTLTRRDTLLEFIRYVKGNKEFLIGFLKHLHLLIMMKLGIMPNWKTKRVIFQYFFGGMTLEKFNEYCEKFAKEKTSLLRKKGMAAVNKAMMDGEKWNVFVLDLSFLGWNILGACTLGILTVFYVAPYQYLTHAALYGALKQKMMRMGYDGQTYTY